MSGTVCRPARAAAVLQTLAADGGMSGMRTPDPPAAANWYAKDSGPYSAIGDQYDMTSSAAGVDAVSSEAAVKTWSMSNPPSRAWATAFWITGPSSLVRCGIPISSASAAWPMG